MHQLSIDFQPLLLVPPLAADIQGAIGDIVNKLKWAIMIVGIMAFLLGLGVVIFNFATGNSRSLVGGIGMIAGVLILVGLTGFAIPLVVNAQKAAEGFAGDQAIPALPDGR